MKILNNINRNLLFIFLLSVFTATYTANVLLITLTTIIGLILVSNFFITESGDDSHAPINQCTFDGPNKDISFFDDFNSDD